MALSDYPSGYDVRAAMAIYEALTYDRTDARDWDDLPEHRRWRYITAAMAAARELNREPGARVIAFRSAANRGGAALG